MLWLLVCRIFLCSVSVTPKFSHLSDDNGRYMGSSSPAHLEDQKGDNVGRSSSSGSSSSESGSSSSGKHPLVWQKFITRIIHCASFYTRYSLKVCKTHGIYLEKHVQIRILIVHQQMALMPHSHPNRNIYRPGIFYIPHICFQ